MITVVQVVEVCGVWVRAVLSRTGLPRPPPGSWPTIVSELSTGRLLLSVMVSALPLGTVIRGGCQVVPPIWAFLVIA